MNELIKELEPKRVFYYFDKISEIPRGSYNTQRISEYIASVGRSLNLNVYTDEIGNVIIKKEASKGRENDTGVILQGHMDMVCEKTLNSNHDFNNDGLKLFIDGDFLGAKNTTLGGDDGVAVCYMLALLEDDSISHPTLECVFTVDEEVGMLGAKALDVNALSGKYLINLDSEEDGTIWAGCAGGITIRSTFDLKKVSSEGIKADIILSGLAGGHSGSEIDKEHMNASIIMGRICNDMFNIWPCRLVSLSGGNKDNAIPLFAKCTMLINPDDIDEINDFIKEYEIVLKEEACLDDSNLSLTIDFDTQVICDVISEEDTKNIFFFLNLLPNGVFSMSSDVKGLVETSNNLGILDISEKFLAEVSVRSSIATKKIMLANKIIMLTESIGGNIEILGDYPAWEFKKESKLRDIMVDIYDKMYGKKPEVVVIHAGLECGYFASVRDDLDIVSIGPNMRDIHTTNERLSISSTKKLYEYLIEVLARIS